MRKKIYNKLDTVFTIIFLSNVFSVLCYAQSNNTPKVNPYFINFSAIEHEIYEISDPSVNIEYRDFTGDGKDLILNIYNWNGVKEKSYSLSKNYGLNYFSVSISDVFNKWNFEKNYRFEVVNSNRLKSSVLVKKTEIKPNELFNVGISAIPINLDCNVTGVTVIDFYSNINGGKYPYELCWMVYNDASTKLLNEPKFETLNKAGDVSSIRVEADPGYNVFLIVKDACGNEVDQNLLIDCEMNDENQNSLFFETLNPKIIQIEN